MLVRELMTTEPVTVTPGTPIKVALGLLADHGITSLPVLGRHGRLRGVVSEADLIRDRVPLDPRAHELPVDDRWHDPARLVGDVMSVHAVTVRPDTEVAQAVHLLTSTTVKSVPVVDHDDRLVGVLSRSDVVRALARSDTELARDVETMLASVGLEDWVVEVADGMVTLSGPDDSRQAALARVVASTVPGVVDVTRD
jgi:CBS-domain-containing membrane protein